MTDQLFGEVRSLCAQIGKKEYARPTSVHRQLAELLFEAYNKDSQFAKEALATYVASSVAPFIKVSTSTGSHIGSDQRALLAFADCVGHVVVESSAAPRHLGEIVLATFNRAISLRVQHVSQYQGGRIMCPHVTHLSVNRHASRVMHQLTAQLRKLQFMHWDIDDSVVANAESLELPHALKEVSISCRVEHAGDAKLLRKVVDKLRHERGTRPAIRVTVKGKPAMRAIHESGVVNDITSIDVLMQSTVYDVFNDIIRYTLPMNATRDDLELTIRARSVDSLLNIARNDFGNMYTLPPFKQLNLVLSSGVYSFLSDDDPKWEEELSGLAGTPVKIIRSKHPLRR